MVGGRIRVAMAGVGHWHGPRHLESVLAAGARIVGVYDPLAPVAERFARDLECLVYDDWRALFQDSRPDLALIMGRPNDTGEMARCLLEEGLPFVAEKPLGTHAGRLAPLVDLERERGAFAAVALAMRYSPLWAKLGELREQGRLGPVTHAHFRIINGPPTRYARDGVGWMLDPEVAGGGPVINLGIHCTDAFCWLVSEPVEVVSAQVSYLMHGERIEDFGAAMLRSESGVIGTVEAGYTYPSMGAGGKSSGDREWRVSSGVAYLIEDGKSLRVVNMDGQEESCACPPSGEYYARLHADVLDCLRQGRPAPITIADCYRALQLVDRIYEKAGVRPSGGPLLRGTGSGE